MNITSGIAAVIAVFALAAAYTIYAGLIRKKNQALEALSGIDVQLARRYGLLPEILNIARRYMQHEKELLTEVTALRSSLAANLRSMPAGELQEGFGKAEALNSAMDRLFAVAENYPDLKSDRAMSKAMEVYQDTEENLAASRRFYNSAVKELNNTVEIFPGSMIAAIIGIGAYPFFHAEERAHARVSAADCLHN
jgi:LemA protein